MQRPLREWHYDRLPFNQEHNVVISYTWDVPSSSSSSALARAFLDGWQVSGENALVSGEWAAVTFTTTDNFEFSGGDGGQGEALRTVRPNVIADPRLSNPDPLTGYFNTAAFARPSGRGDRGNASRNPVQRPGINNWNLATFKNVRLDGARTLQFRAEFYNVLNKVQFSDIDRGARFDAQGRQINTNFGKATETRPARNMQLSVRFSF